MQAQSYYVPSTAPVGQLKTNRGLLKYLLLSLVTLGIYSIVFYSSISGDINVIVWYHRISNRIGGELRRRNIPYSFGASDFWLWNILGLLIAVGPLIYLYKLCRATNSLAEHYNRYG